MTMKQVMITLPVLASARTADEEVNARAVYAERNFDRQREAEDLVFRYQTVMGEDSLGEAIDQSPDGKIVTFKQIRHEALDPESDPRCEVERLTKQTAKSLLEDATGRIGWGAGLKENIFGGTCYWFDQGEVKTGLLIITADEAQERRPVDELTYDQLADPLGFGSHFYWENDYRDDQRDLFPVAYRNRDLEAGGNTLTTKCYNGVNFTIVKDGDGPGEFSISSYAPSWGHDVEDAPLEGLICGPTGLDAFGETCLNLRVCNVDEGESQNCNYFVDTGEVASFILIDDSTGTPVFNQKNVEWFGIAGFYREPEDVNDGVKPKPQPHA